MRVLIAGVGNVLRGDDGFGIEVLQRLQREPPAEGVQFFESGIAGISLVQELMDGYDALVIIDALDRGAEPGRVFVLQPDQASLSTKRMQNESTDLHQADPEAVLQMAHAMKVLPERIWIVGCQAVGCDDLGAPLSEAVANAVPIAVQRVREIAAGLTSERMCHAAT